MQVARIEVDRAKAADLYRQYREHRHYSTPVDDAIRKAYRAVSKGQMVIQALESIKRAGLNEEGLPKLAIARADLPRILCLMREDGSARFCSEHAQRVAWRRDSPQTAADIRLPPGTFPAQRRHYRWHAAAMPIIPVYLRPRQALDAYHVLWEAEWTPTPPRDPYLLRRIGSTGDLWMVVAAWDLTEVERAAMATQVRVT